jgi:hypothetical protein
MPLGVERRNAGRSPVDPLTIGADVATMAGGLSVVTATSVWTLKQWREYRQRRAAAQERNWHGYINPGTINEWDVRLAEDPGEATGRVVLEVLGSDGEPHPNQADNMRQAVLRHGKLARTPTPEEWAFLVHLRKERGYGQGEPVR